MCLGRRNQISGHSDIGICSNLGASSIFTWVLADTASAACPCATRQSGNNVHDFLRLSLVMLVILVQWILHTILNHLSQCHLGVRPLPLYYWYWGSDSEFLRWHRSMDDAKWTFLPLFLASSITSFCLSDFHLLPCWYLSPIFPIFFPPQHSHLEFFECSSEAKLVYQTFNGIGISNFLQVLFPMCLYSSLSGSMKKIPRNCLA